MNAQEIKTLINNWVNAKIQFEQYNDKLKELAKEILNFVNTNYRNLLSDFAQGYQIHLNKIKVDNNNLYITYTDSWTDYPEYATLVIPLDEVWHYEKYFEKLYDDYLKDQAEKERMKNEFLEREEYETYMRLKQKFEK